MPESPVSMCPLKKDAVKKTSQLFCMMDFLLSNFQAVSMSPCVCSKETLNFFQLSLFQNLGLCPCVHSKKTQEKIISIILYDGLSSDQSQAVSMCPCVRSKETLNHFQLSLFQNLGLCPCVRSKKTQEKIISIVLFDVLPSEQFPGCVHVSMCPLKRDTEFFSA